MGPVRMRARAADAHAPDVILLEPVLGGPRLAVSVTAAEARELVAASHEAEACGPGCDGILEPVRRLEAAVRRATLDAEDGQLEGRLTLETGAGEFALRCAAADAIRLALGARAPIYATRSALALASDAA